MAAKPAPPWHTTAWFNHQGDLQLADLRGRVVMLHAFQMLCPGCVSRALPQARRVVELFAGAPLAVIGLHTVFEHHEAMGEPALRAFIHEYRVRYPVGVDAPGVDGDPLPLTMRAYAMQGTPTTVLIDAQGRVRRQAFGIIDDLLLGAELGALLSESEAARPAARTSARPSSAGCDDDVCATDDASGDDTGQR